MNNSSRLLKGDIIRPHLGPCYYGRLRGEYSLYFIFAFIYLGWGCGACMHVIRPLAGDISRSPPPPVGPGDWTQAPVLSGGPLAGPVFLVLNLPFLYIRKALMMGNKTEMRLFHATSRVHVDYICQNNFERILYGSLENRYGKGLCWSRASEDSSSSHAFVEMFWHCSVNLHVWTSVALGEKWAELPSACAGLWGPRP